MQPTHAFLFALVLVAVHNVLPYPVQVDVESEMMSLENEYLDYLFQSIQDSGRQPNSDGDINLLPEESKTFANMVQCVAEGFAEEKDSTTMTTRRTLSYNLKGNIMSSTQHLVAFHLVIPSSEYSNLFEVSVYAEGSESPEATGSSRGEYIDLNVNLMDKPAKFPLEVDTLYKIAITIRSPDGQTDDETLSNILCSLKPLLVIYSYDRDILQNLFNVPDIETNSNVFKRSLPESISLPEPYESLEQMKEEFCQVHTINLTSFGPLHENRIPSHFEFKKPAFPTFSFCYGHCRSEGSTERLLKTSTHAKLIRNDNPELEDAGISPCCIPTEYGYTDLHFTFQNHSVAGMVVVMNLATACGCF